MKKRILTIAIALMVAVLTVTPCLAYDHEDPCVADNQDFIWGQGWDGGYPDGILESYYGEQSWTYYETPSDGYNLYQDDITDTGNLDSIQSLVTRTPDVIDLTDATTQYFDMDGGFYYMTSISPDTWYWALEPRGFDNPPAPVDGPSWMPTQNQFTLWYGGIESYNWIDGNSLPAIDQTASGHWNGVSFNMRVVIPEGTQVYGGYCLRLCQINGELSLRALDGGTMTFSNPIRIYLLVDGEWVEIGSSKVI